MAISISETLARKELIDNRETKVITKSIIDAQTERLRTKLHDETLDSRFVAVVIQKLSEADIEDLLDYCLRKAKNPGRAFVKLCSNVMKYHTLN